MPNLGLSVGRDITFTISIPGGNLTLTPDVISDFEPKPKVNVDAWLPINGIQKNILFHMGWEGNFNLSRQSPELDIFWATQEENYYAGVNQGGGTLIETIQEADGSITQWIYTGVVIKVDSLGSWKGDAVVKPSISFMAGRRKPLQ